jgi:hypothetical protein
VATIHLELEVGETGFPAPLLPPLLSREKTPSRMQRSSSSTPCRQPVIGQSRRRRRSDGGGPAPNLSRSFHAWLVSLANGLLCLTERKPRGGGKPMAAQEGFLHRHSRDDFTQDAAAVQRSVRRAVSPPPAVAISPRKGGAVTATAAATSNDQYVGADTDLLTETSTMTQHFPAATSCYGPSSTNTVTYAAPQFLANLPAGGGIVPAAGGGMVTTAAKPVPQLPPEQQGYSHMATLMPRIPTWQRYSVFVRFLTLKYFKGSAHQSLFLCNGWEHYVPYRCL